MTRERKLSKWSVVNALSRSRTVVAAADYLGVHRDTVYENAKRFGVDIPAVLGSFYDAIRHPPAPLFGPAAPSAPSSAPLFPPEPAAAPAKPERNMREEIMRRTAAAFSGPNRGDAGGSERRSGSADELLVRYRRLKGK